MKKLYLLTIVIASLGIASISAMDISNQCHDHPSMYLINASPSQVNFVVTFNSNIPAVAQTGSYKITQTYSVNGGDTKKFYFPCWTDPQVKGLHDREKCLQSSTSASTNCLEKIEVEEGGTVVASYTSKGLSCSTLATNEYDTANKPGKFFSYKATFIPAQSAPPASGSQNNSSSDSKDSNSDSQDSTSTEPQSLPATIQVTNRTC